MTGIRWLVVLTFLAGWNLVPRWSWAQTPVTPVAPPGAPPSAEGWSGTVILGLTAVAVVVILGVVAKLYDRRQKREADAIGLQSRLSDALLMDRALQGAIVTPTVRAPVWKGSPLTIEVSGDVPTPELRDTVLRVVRREALQYRPDVEIEDKLLIVPARTARVA
jgi:hypothetical protein